MTCGDIEIRNLFRECLVRPIKRPCVHTSSGHRQRNVVHAIRVGLGHRKSLSKTRCFVQQPWYGCNLVHDFAPCVPCLWHSENYMIPWVLRKACCCPEAIALWHKPRPIGMHHTSRRQATRMLFERWSDVSCEALSKHILEFEVFGRTLFLRRRWGPSPPRPRRRWAKTVSAEPLVHKMATHCVHARCR